MQNPLLPTSSANPMTLTSLTSSQLPSASNHQNEGAVLIAYNVVCRALRTVPVPQIQDVLTSTPWHRGICIVSDIDGDVHMLAFSAALLIACGASANLVRRFVITFNPTVCTTTLAAIVSLDRLSSQFPYDRLGPNTESWDVVADEPLYIPTISEVPFDQPQPSSLLRWIPFFLDFSSSLILSPVGASTIIAATLLMPVPLLIELDLRLCPRVTHLSLDRLEWQSLLNDHISEQQRNGLPTARIIGLALDATPIYKIHPTVLFRLPYLQWISLRSTHIRNVFRAGEIVHGLPALRAALFHGSCDDEVLFNALRYKANPELFRFNRERLLSQIPFSLRYDETRKLVDSAVFNFADLIGERSCYSKELFPKYSPVVMSHCYQNYILATGGPHFRWLDGKSYHTTHIAYAQHCAQHKFEHCPLSVDLTSHVQGVVPHSVVSHSVAQMLRSRELGLLPPRLSLTASHHLSTGSKAHRAKKRKRSAVCTDASLIPNVDAALVAAGFPSLTRGTALSSRESVVLALTAVAARWNVLDPISSHDELRRVEQAMLGGYNLHANSFANSHDDEPPPLSAPIANCIFKEGAFEHSASSALMVRIGSPKINYFVQNRDEPRQFEYNPARASELVYGTDLGYLVVMDAETGLVRGCCSVGGGPGHRQAGEVIGRRNRLEELIRPRPAVDDGAAAGVNFGGAQPRERKAVFGLSWLNKHRDLFLSGTHEEGHIHLYNVEWMSNGTNGGCVQAAETFENLTSIHVNADDRYFAVSGRSSNVGLFDVGTGRRVETMMRCHSNSINVIKFAHHNPNILITSSFDRSVRKWDLRERRLDSTRRAIFTIKTSTDVMTVSFSPDDERLLVSAVDNEVAQYCASDGRLIARFDIQQTGRGANFTRSYYMNGRDYIVSGSCAESVVRVYNARSFKCVTEVDVDERVVPPPNKLYVQSLRGNPLRPYNFCALLVSPTQLVGHNLEQPLLATVDLRSRW